LSVHEFAEVKNLLRRLTLIDDEALMPLTAPCGSAERLRARAREIVESRQQRLQLFGAGMFTETAWDLLLLLYLGQPGARQTISSLALAAGSSKSTAIRWFAYLEHRKLAQREPHPTDKRAAFVSLTEKGRDLLDAYLAGTLTNGS
jgi:DNA-binding MarR family transcriptional regulator